MSKKLVGYISAKLLRAALGRVATDIELHRTIWATHESALFVEKHMQAATACVSRLDVMLAAIRARSDGFICELGVYRGHSLNELARRNPSEKVYGFDTFEGLPEFWREGFPKGSFETSLDEIKSRRTA